MKKGKNNSLYIIIIIALLVILISIGLVMSLKQKDDEADKGEIKKKEDNRCVESLCISKVSVEDSEESNGIILALKNEGNETIANQCVKVIADIQEYKLCITELEAGKETTLNFEKTDNYGKNIEDYKLIKYVEEENIVENNEENQAKQ